MKRNMHGFIEPYTLGFLLSLIGAGVTLSGNPQDDKQVQQETPTEQVQTTTKAGPAAANSTHSNEG